MLYEVGVSSWQMAVSQLRRNEINRTSQCLGWLLLNVFIN
jgi:hypothetical protein